MRILITLVALMILATSTTNASTLPPCPGSPNCVSSQADDSHRIEPFKITGNTRAAIEKLRQVLEQRRDTTVITSDERSISVEFRTTLGFVDDGLFLLDVSNNVIHVRSAARLGYWDLGKNRRRMEEVRQMYLEANR